MALYRKGSINGVSYNFLSHSTTFGRKIVSHEVVRGGRFAEDMGEKLGQFTIQAVITGTTDSQYNRNKKKLDTILKQGGVKSLRHPVYGSKKVFMVDPKITESITDGRKAIYSLVCLETLDNIYPSQIAGNKSWINKKYDELRSALESRFPNAIENVNNFVESYNDIRNNVDDLTTILRDGTEFINGAGDEISAFVTDLLQLQDSLTSLIQAPSNLVARLSTVYDNLTLIVTDPKDLIVVANNLSGKGKNRTRVPGTSTLSTTINEGREFLYYFNDVSLLSSGYQAATIIDYISNEELANIRAQLESLFESISPDIDDDTYYALQNMRIATLEYLETLSPQLPNIVTIRINQTPASVLSYKLYGTTERMDEIIDLNGIANPAYVEGEIKVLSI